MMSTPLWQKLIWGVMFLVVLEGALRKWVFPGLQSQIYLIKDGILILAYAGFLGSTSRNGQHLGAMTGLKTLLIISLAFFLLQLFNPNSPSMLLSLVGLKNYLLYTPLAFVVPYMFSSSADVEKKLRKYTFLMLPFAALGLVQFAFPPDHWINGYLDRDSENLRIASQFGTQVAKARTTGTFSYIGGFTTFLTVMLYLGAGLAAANKWRISGNYFSFSVMVIAIAALFTTGTRAPIYGAVVTLPLVLFVWRSGGLISSGTLLRIGLVGIVASVAVSLISSEAIEAFQYRSEHGDNAVDRILSPIFESYDALVYSPVIGTGMASTHGSAITIVGTTDFWWLPVLVEVEEARVLEEVGIVGFALVYAARLWLIYKAISLGIRFRTPLHAAMSGCIAAFFAQYFYGIVINNPTAGIYYWFAAGLLFGMYRVEAEELVPRIASTSKGQSVRGEDIGRRPSIKSYEKSAVQ